MNVKSFFHLRIDFLRSALVLSGAACLYFVVLWFCFFKIKAAFLVLYLVWISAVISSSCQDAISFGFMWENHYKLLKFMKVGMLSSFQLLCFLLHRAVDRASHFVNSRSYYGRC